MQRYIFYLKLKNNYLNKTILINSSTFLPMSLQIDAPLESFINGFYKYL